MFDENGIEAVKKFGRESGWLEERWGERRRWSKDRKEEWGKRWIERNRGKAEERIMRRGKEI